MADRNTLILDEPTTGLDPLMRAEFIEILNAEKKKGKTIFMSSHMFEEVEDTCDKVALIKDGEIIAVKSTLEIKRNENKEYKIEFTSGEEYRRFLIEPIVRTVEREDSNQVHINVNDKDINTFMAILKNYHIKFITEIKYSLEDYFKSLYIVPHQTKEEINDV
jgi:ABC-2 type transport system ATP-binding protein